MVRAKRIWTIGYEGHSPESFVLRLRAAEIERLVDIRELPLSRKAGFSKSSLALGLAIAGIEYSHMRMLGTPRAVRHAYKGGGTFETFREAYLAHVAQNDGAVADLERVASAERVALMCVEQAPDECHRSVLGGVLALRGWRVTDLSGKERPS